KIQRNRKNNADEKTARPQIQRNGKNGARNRMAKRPELSDEVRGSGRFAALLWCAPLSVALFLAGAPLVPLGSAPFGTRAAWDLLPFPSCRPAKHRPLPLRCPTHIVSTHIVWGNGPPQPLTAIPWLDSNPSSDFRGARGAR